MIDNELKNLNKLQLGILNRDYRHGLRFFCKLLTKSQFFLFQEFELRINTRVLLRSAPMTLFKHSKLRNYSLKRLNCSISNALNTHIFIKSYYLRPLTSVSGALVNISLNIITSKNLSV